MKTNLLRFIIFIIFIITSGFLHLPRIFAAPSLTISPSSATVANGDTAQFTITINTDSTQVFGADAIISYTSSDVDIVSAGNGGFFSDFSSSNNGSGTLVLHGYQANLYDSKSGSGNLATFSIKSKKGSGTGTLSFSCGGGSTSQILDTNGQNVLSCGSLNQTSLTFSGTAPTNTPTPTPGGGNANPTATPTPSSQSGGASGDPVCTNLTANPTSGKAQLWVNMTCSGNTSNADITGAEFSFGNGVVVNVDKNIGTNGSITTTYGYPSAGKFTAACRLKNNHQRYSQTPDACKQLITVSSTTTTTTTLSGGSKTVGTNTATTPTPTPTGNPNTPQVVALAPYTSITPIPTQPSATSEEPSTPAPNSRWGLGLGIIIVSILLGGFLILRSRKSRPPTPFPPFEQQQPAQQPVETSVVSEPPVEVSQQPSQPETSATLPSQPNS